MRILRERASEPWKEHRAVACAKRAAGIKAKARELAALCGARVALVVVRAHAPPLVWESSSEEQEGGGVPGLIQDERARAKTYKNRTRVIQKQVVDLATLCGVQVALVVLCAEYSAGVVWESELGVLDRYGAALGPEIRDRIAM